MAHPLVRVFEQEPELLRKLARWDADEARQTAVARLIDLKTGRWRPPLVRLGVADLGLLVLDGLIIRRTEVIERTAVELVGAGDVVRPWTGDEDDASVPASLSVEVCQPTRVALLDRGFVTTISRWPEIMPQIVERMSARVASLGFQLAIARLPHLEDRLVCILWHLADRWGRVDREGVVLRLSLSQQVLGELASASRPSVSSALGRLSERGLVRRAGPRQYRLHGRPPTDLDDLPGRSSTTRVSAIDERP